MKRVSARIIAEVLDNAERVAIFGHVQPDSDCYGSAVGLKIGLESAGKKAFVYLPDDLPYNLAFLNGFAVFGEEKMMQNVDAVVIVDSASLGRIHAREILENYKQKGIQTILLDHHLASDLINFADIGWQDEKVSSVSEMVLAVLKEMNATIQKDIATYLLAGIEGDTGSFQNQNTTKDSFEDAAYLMSKGARFRSIIANAVNSKRNINLIKLYGLALERVVYNKKYKTAATYVTLQDLKNYGLEEEASYSEMINFLNTIGGIKMIVLITEREEGVLKVSLRTRDDHVNVQRLANAFGGGGHIKASGFSLSGKIVSENGRVKISCP